MVRREEHGAAVDPAGKADADRLGLRDAAQPLCDLVHERGDVAPADHGGVRREGVALGREVPRIRGRRIGAAHQLDLDDVVGGHHPRVARVKLAVEALALEKRVDRVDSVGDDERGPRGLLGEEVAQRAVERASEDHAPAVPRDEREGAVDLAHGVGNAAGQARTRLVGRHVVDAIAGRVGEVDHALDVLVAHGVVLPSPTHPTAAVTARGGAQSGAIRARLGGLHRLK